MEEVSGFPVPDILAWLPARPGHAAPPEPGPPAVSRAAGVPTHLPAEATTADGGAGRAPGRGVDALDPYVAPPRVARPATTTEPLRDKASTLLAGVAPQVDDQYPPSGYSPPTLTPELLVAAHDPDASAGAMAYDFLVYDAAGTKIADSGWITSRAWTVPSGKLQWGKRYSWTVGAMDGTGAVSTSQTLNALSTQVPQPPITSELSQNDGRGFDPQVGNYTTSATDAGVATVGPALAIERSYNSRDPRLDGAFGAGWATIIDSRATEQRDAAGAVRTVVVTYPGGQDVAFGRNADGTFAPPLGRFASFAAVTGGYRLVDKDGTTYLFTTATGATGRTGLTSVADAQGRATTLTYASGRATRLTSASGRSLSLTWTMPTGATGQHVATVVTDPVTAGDASSALTWSYTYTGDLLTKVCAPTSSTECTTYSYGNGTRYPGTVDNTGPRSYWRLGDAAGSTVATSSVLDNSGTDNGQYANVTLGQPGALAGSTATAAGFNGTSSRVQLPSKLVAEGSYQAVSMWFKTTMPGGVLFSYQASPVTNATTTSNYTPSLYVGASGKLYGQFWTGGVGPIVTTGAVTDGNWHHVVLSAAGNTQSLYVDGSLVGSKSGLVQMYNAASAANSYLGAGFLGGAWPDNGKNGTGNTGYATFFTGTIGEVGYFDKPLTADEVAALNSTARATARPLTSVVRPSGNASATVSYDPKTGALTQATDVNGGVWKVGAPTVSGSGQVYSGAVLGAGPVDYWRFAENGTVDAVNQVNGNVASYNAVTLGVTGGPLGDSTVAGFNGTSSYVRLPAASNPVTGPASVSMWFRMPANSTAGGVLFGYQNGAVTDTAGTTAQVPALYVGIDGKLRGGYWTGDPTRVLASAGKVNDGNWHHVALAASTNSQTLYLDGVAVGAALSAALVAGGGDHVSVGAGKWNATTPSRSAAAVGYFPGSIGEVAVYRGQLSTAQVQGQFAARAASTGVPVKTVVVTDPGNRSITNVYDIGTGRQISTTDALGNKTQYGYDVGGFLRTVTDPNGNVTTNEHDVRGNTVSQTTCQDQSANRCSTVYYTYYPDSTTTVLNPDPRNDVLLTTRDGRSSSATDATYLTTYAYDAAGNRVSATDPLGRTTVTTFTDGTTVAAADGGFAPAGLPTTVTTPGGVRQRVVYFRSGEVATVTDPAGKVTRFTYDGLGRLLTETEVTSTFPAGLTTGYTYDKLGRVVKQSEPPTTNRVTGAVHTAVTTTVYNADGQVVSETVADPTGGDASRTESATYNARGQQDTVTDSAGKTTRYGYDAYGNIVLETEPDGGQTASTYDAEGNLLTSTLVAYTGDPNAPGSPVNFVLTSKAYDPSGRLGSVTDAMGWVTAYTYTDNGLTATITRRDPASGATFVTERNSYDAAGNLLSQVTNNGVTTVSFAVDAANRTTTSTVDPAGLRRTTTHEYNRDDDVVAQTVSDPSGLVSRSETLHDQLGRPLAHTVHNGALAPMARWRLAETAGATTARDTGGNSTGAATGVTWTTDRGGAATFNGTSSAIATTGPVLDTARSFTVAAWVNPTSATGARNLLAQDGKSASGLTLGVDASVWSLSMADRDDAAASAVTVRSPQAAPLNTWSHVTGVFDAAARQLRLYVNGTLVATQALPAAFVPWTATGPMTLGQGRGGFFAGALSDVQAYSRALTPSEVGGVFGGTVPAAGAAMVRESWARDEAGLVTVSVDPLGRATNHELDADGEAVATISPAVSTEANGGAALQARPVSYAGYNTFGQRTEVKDPLGNVSTTRYDAAGRPVSMRLPSYTPPGSTTAIVPESTATYDVNGQLVSRTDAPGNVTTYTYDQFGRLAKVTAPNNGTTTYTYDAVGNLLSETDPTGARSESTYDFLGRRITDTDIVRQSGQRYTTTNVYGTGGWPSRQVWPNGTASEATYNAVGEVVTGKDPAGAVTTYAYDGEGRTVRETAADGTFRTVTYDMAGRDVATRRYDAAGVQLTAESSEYDAAGNLLAAVDARGTRTTFAYDGTGMVVSETQPVSATDSITTTFGYDAAGNRTRFTDGRGNPFVFTYNSLGLPESQIEPATTAYPNAADRTFTLVYDANGDPVSQRLPGGVSVTNTFDVMGNMTKQAGAGAEAVTADRTFGYDLGGRLTSASAPGGTNTFTYDDRGLVLTTTGPSGAATFSYNSMSSMTSRVDAAGTTSYTYDSANRLATVANPTTGVQLRLGYTPLSQPSTITYGNNGNLRSLGYDSLHRLTSDELKTSAGASIARITYGYDANDNVTSKTTTGFVGQSSNTYAYDRADRLVLWNSGSAVTNYSYDKSGNRTSAGAKTFTYDQRNQLVTGDNTTFKYTARGTLQSASNLTGTYSTRTDAFGQVASQDAAGGTQTYAYDALGRVVRDGFAYSGLDNTLAADGTARYTRDDDDDLVGVASGTTQTYAWVDLHTDVVGQFTATGTTLPGSTTYDPLGQVLGSAGMLGNLGFQSGWTDFATGRVNMWNRWYNTLSGQFDTRDAVDVDPVPDSVNANRFAYAEDNPMTMTDPIGHWPSCGWCSKGLSKLKSGYHAVTSTVSRGVSKLKSGLKAVGKKLKSVGSKIKKTLKGLANKGKRLLKHLYNKGKKLLKKGYNIVKRKVKGFIGGAKKWIADKGSWAKRKLKQGLNKLQQGGKWVVAKTSRGLKVAGNKLQDGWHASEKWVKDNKNAIIEGVAIGLGVVAGIACTAASGGTLVVACMIGTAAIINLGKDAAQGKIHNAGDAFGSLGMGALQGAAGLFGGALGGKLVGAGLSRFGSGMSSLGGRMFAGAADGAAGDAITQFMLTGKVDLRGVAESAALGGLTGGRSRKRPTKCETHSFARDTKVLMADGSTKAIKDVRVGDRVVATDPATGRTEARTVTKQHINRDRDLTDLAVRTPDGSTRTVETTQQHPFWNDTARKFVAAGTLVGAVLFGGQAATAGTAQAAPVVESVTNYTGDRVMYDLTVDEIHTYYVLAGGTPLLVHNCGTGGPTDRTPYDENGCQCGDRAEYRFKVNDKHKWESTVPEDQDPNGPVKKRRDGVKDALDRAEKAGQYMEQGDEVLEHVGVGEDMSVDVDMTGFQQGVRVVTMGILAWKKWRETRKQKRSGG
ncbi:LamG-like jellyroll fold domain-containing protein [Virgisporangium aurantiacum]|uniref:LamG-like jellyroll fold domain-containing protein n=1 Tax=Virgisporangium aurantiacum TaxID=175570 RepID=UPI00194E44DE|nr:LamG-like jellyroll fold domain-containing protein [Virgisporangium aurantiacum]